MPPAYIPGKSFVTLAQPQYIISVKHPAAHSKEIVGKQVSPGCPGEQEETVAGLRPSTLMRRKNWPALPTESSCLKTVHTACDQAMCEPGWQQFVLNVDEPPGTQIALWAPILRSAEKADLRRHSEQNEPTAPGAQMPPRPGERQRTVPHKAQIKSGYVLIKRSSIRPDPKRLHVLSNTDVISYRHTRGVRRKFLVQTH